MNLAVWISMMSIKPGWCRTYEKMVDGRLPERAALDAFIPHFATHRVMIAQGFGFTRGFSPEWNSGTISEGEKSLVDNSVGTELDVRSTPEGWGHGWPTSGK